MKEDFLQYVWKYKKISQDLTLTSGESLVILSFGEYNSLSGPDFFNAKLQIGKQQWAGNVEIHCKSSHWYAHRHEQDAAYNNVILHVVWEHDVEVFDSNQQVIPTLELKNQIDTQLIANYENLLLSKSNFISCEKHYAEVEKMIFLSWNERLFVERLENKSEIVKKILVESKNNWERVLFLVLLKSFGGNINGELFLEIGKSFDFSVVRKERTNPLHLEALFFGQSNLLSTEKNDDIYHAELMKIYRFLRQKYDLRPILQKLNFARLRPQNFPTIRLSQLAQLYEKHESLFSELIENKSFNKVEELLSVNASEYWDTHYTFGKNSAKRIKKVSKSLIDLIWINSLNPVKYLYSKYLGKEILEHLIEVTLQINPEKNTVTDRFKELGIHPSSAFDTQVLLQQYRNYCQSKRCLHCAIGVSLLTANLQSNK